MIQNDLEVQCLRGREAPYAVFDDEELFLLVAPTGEKYWYRRVVKDEREMDLPIGRYPDISLEKARMVIESLRERQRGPVIFSDVAQEWLEMRYAPVCTPRTIENMRYTLRRYVLPEFGGRDISSITSEEVLDLIRGVQILHCVSAGHRARNCISQIFRYAVASGYCDANPARGVEDAIVPLKKRGHYIVLKSDDELRKLFSDIGDCPSVLVRYGLMLLAYTFVRASELALAEWAEIDFDRGLWRIPQEHMKMKRSEHLVPLARQVADMLRELREAGRHPRYLFPSLQCDKPISRMTYAKVLRDIGYGRGKMTPHGFRIVASTHLNEMGWPPDVIERQLAHIGDGRVRAAYNHADYLPQRCEMMQAWADYLDGLRKK